MDKRTKGDDQEENEGGKDNIKFRRKFRRKKRDQSKSSYLIRGIQKR